MAPTTVVRSLADQSSRNVNGTRVRTTFFFYPFPIFVFTKTIRKPSNRYRIGRGGDTYEDERTFRNIRIVFAAFRGGDIVTPSSAAKNRLFPLLVHAKAKPHRRLIICRPNTTFFHDCFTHGSGQSCNRLSPPTPRPSLANGRRVS